MSSLVVAVTGAASGIGYAVSRALGKAGYAVALVDLDVAQCRARASEMCAAGVEAFPLECDVASKDSVGRVFACRRFDHGRLHGVVHCAGVTARRNLFETSDAEWRKVADINLAGTFNVLAESAARVRKGGSIVGISSIVARIGYGFPAYTASKGGVSALIREAASELAPNIRVNSISPGLISTPLNDSAFSGELRAELASTIPMQRMGSPDDVAQAALFLVSDRSAYITGSDIVVDGGLSSAIAWGVAGQLMVRRGCDHSAAADRP